MIKLHRTRETTDYQYISYHSSMKRRDQTYVTMIKHKQNHNLNTIIPRLTTI